MVARKIERIKLHFSGLFRQSRMISKVRGTEQESFDNNDLILCFPLMSLVRP